MNTFDDIYQRRLDLMNLGNHSEPESDSDSDSENETAPSLISKQKYLVISSNDRDWSELNTDTHNYNVKLSVVGNSMEINNQNLTQYVGQTENAFIINNLRNIKSIGIKNLIIPNLSLDIKDRMCTRFFQHKFENAGDISYSYSSNIKDLPFLLIRISEINGIWDSTNNEINNALALMVPARTDVITEGIDNRDTNVINGINREVMSRHFCYYHNIEEWEKRYYPNVLNSLNMLSIQILDNLGNPIKLISDFLDIKNIKLSKQTDSSNVYINKIIITTEKYFSYYEYQEGDIITLKNVSINSNKSSSVFNLSMLETYLNKGEFPISSINVSDNCKLMSNQLTINFPHKINFTNGNLEIDPSYLNNTIIPDDDILFTSNLNDTGKILNRYLQNTITLSVETLEHDASIITNNIV